MKGIFVLAALAAVVVSLAIGSTVHAERVATESPIRNITNEASHALKYRVTGSGSYYNFKCIAAEDGDAVCSATRYFRSPPDEFRLYWCEGINDDWGMTEKQEGCILFERVPGDQSCHYLLQSGMSRSEVHDSGCVWGVDHDYTIVVTLNAVGGMEVDYSSAQRVNPDTGRPYPRRPGRVLNADCKRIMREMARTGEYGPVPECAGSRYRYEQDAGTVAVE